MEAGLLRRARTRLRPAAPRLRRRPRFGPRARRDRAGGGARSRPPDNVDPLRHPDGAPPGLPPSTRVRRSPSSSPTPISSGCTRSLADDASRELMVQLFAFRLLGASKVRLRSAAVARGTRSGTSCAACAKRRASWISSSSAGSGDRYDLRRVGYPIVLDAHFLNVARSSLEQYRCPQHPDVGVRPGDVVIDGGGCWGDTALYLRPRGRTDGPGADVRVRAGEPGAPARESRAQSRAGRSRRRRRARAVEHVGRAARSCRPSDRRPRSPRAASSRSRRSRSTISASSVSTSSSSTSRAPSSRR